MALNGNKNVRNAELLKYITLLTIVLGTGAAVIGMSGDDWSRIFNSEWLPVEFVVILLVLGIAYNVMTVVLGAFCYREKPILPDDQLPSCTVIVPAYNEGAAVKIAIDSVMQSNYPAEKLEIIAIDDGSKDDTWEWMRKAAAPYGRRVRCIRLDKNGGKRHAIHYGTMMSANEIIVTVDSDSRVEADSLRRLNSPFCDPAVGAVAGSVRVSNLNDGVLPRMMDAHFAFSFRVLRAAHSVMRSVICTPGALSAYRRSALLQFLDRWLMQTFCGSPAGIGEDRALTTFMLRYNWRVLYQRSATVFTEMPSTYQPTQRMMIRWERGNIREMLFTYQFAFRSFDWFHLGIQLNLIFQTYLFIQSVFLIPVVLIGISLAPILWCQCMFLSTVLWTSLPAAIYWGMCGGSGWIWAYTYSFFRTFFLFWISPYSLFTVRNSNWLTRGLVHSEETSSRQIRESLVRKLLRKSGVLS